MSIARDQIAKRLASRALPRPDASEPLLTPDEVLVNKQWVATQLGVSAKTVSRMIHRGVFPRPLVLGQMQRWRIRDYRAWLEWFAKEARP
jgi:predicted DNA-binding transcriptional regulator AlpA